MMKEGMKIKVIKRGEIKAPVKTLKKSKRASARDMVSNVTNWVNDLQARKRDETKVAIEKFFNNNPQPSEL
jgi:formylglycine-generating enzyme required for sulfatase activity